MICSRTVRIEKNAFDMLPGIFFVLNLLWSIRARQMVRDYHPSLDPDNFSFTAELEYFFASLTVHYLLHFSCVLTTYSELSRHSEKELRPSVEIFMALLYS